MHALKSGSAVAAPKIWKRGRFSKFMVRAYWRRLNDSIHVPKKCGLPIPNFSMVVPRTVPRKWKKTGDDVRVSFRTQDLGRVGDRLFP